MAILIAGLFAVLVFGAILAVRSLLLMWVWNWVIPDVTTLGTISFMESAGLIIVVALLFGGILARPADPKKGGLLPPVMNNNVKTP